MSVRPWVKVWRPRHGSAFETRVSAPARFLFRGMLALFDESGAMPLPKSKSLHLAFAMAHGYERTDRQVLKRQLAELVEHGCLTSDQDEAGFWTLTATKWGSFQSTESVGQPKKNMATTRRQRDDNATTTDRLLVDNATTTDRLLVPKPSKSLEREKQEGEGDKDKEGEKRFAREPAALTPKPTPRSLARFEDPIGDMPPLPMLRFVHRLWLLFVRHHGTDETMTEERLRLDGKAQGRLRELADWAAETADAHATGDDWAEVASAALTRSLEVYERELDRRGDISLHPGFWYAKRELWAREVAA